MFFFNLIYYYNELRDIYNLIKLYIRYNKYIIMTRHSGFYFKEKHGKDITEVSIDASTLKSFFKVLPKLSPTITSTSSLIREVNRSNEKHCPFEGFGEVLSELISNYLPYLLFYLGQQQWIREMEDQGCTSRTTTNNQPESMFGTTTHGTTTHETKTYETKTYETEHNNEKEEEEEESAPSRFKELFDKIANSETEVAVEIDGDRIKDLINKLNTNTDECKSVLGKICQVFGNDSNTEDNYSDILSKICTFMSTDNDTKIETPETETETPETETPETETTETETPETETPETETTGTETEALDDTFFKFTCPCKPIQKDEPKYILIESDTDTLSDSDNSTYSYNE